MSPTLRAVKRTGLNAASTRRLLFPRIVETKALFWGFRKHGRPLFPPPRSVSRWQDRATIRVRLAGDSQAGVCGKVGLTGPLPHSRWS